MRSRIKLAAIIVAALCVAAKSGYADISNITGWGDSRPVSYEGMDPMNKRQDGVAEGLDIFGEVGHPLTVRAPTATCTSGFWAYDYEIISGTLPPGLSVGKEANDYGSITGIPKEQGHWVVTTKVAQIQCKDEGKFYTGFHQELRFHIAGAGSEIGGD